MSAAFCSVSAAEELSVSAVFCSVSAAEELSVSAAFCSVSAAEELSVSAVFCSVSSDEELSVLTVFVTAAAAELFAVLCELSDSAVLLEADFLLRFADLLLPVSLADELVSVEALDFFVFASLLSDDAKALLLSEAVSDELLSVERFLRCFLEPDFELSELLSDEPSDVLSESVSAELLSVCDFCLRCFVLLESPLLSVPEESAAEFVSERADLSFFDELSSAAELSCACCEDMLGDVSLLLSDELDEVLEQPEASMHIASTRAAALILLFSFMAITLFLL